MSATHNSGAGHTPASAALEARKTKAHISFTREINARRRVLERGLIACYEIIDRIRKELAELGRATTDATRAGGES